MISNYHTHSKYCDGRCLPREYALYAEGHGFDILGFSSHAPVPFPNNFSVRDEEYTAYCDDVRALKEEFAGRLEIHLGLEIDYIPFVQEDFRPLVDKGGLEYVIGGVHLIPNPAEFDSGNPDTASQLWFIDGPLQKRYDEGLQRIFHGDIRAGVRAYFHQQNAMIERNRPTVIAHCDKIVMHNRERFFSQNDKWFRDLLYETLDLMQQHGCICEINTRGLYKGRHTDFYPSSDTIRHMNQMGIPVLVGTDAHRPSDLDRFENAYGFLRDIGYRNIVFKI